MPFICRVPVTAAALDVLATPAAERAKNSREGIASAPGLKTQTITERNAADVYAKANEG